MLDERYHESFLKKLINNLLIFKLKLFSYLPFWVLYGLSDILYYPLRYVARYRKKVIEENLRNSFPEKSGKEIKEIMGKYYHHFCDLAVETIKAHHMSDKEYEKRLHFTNYEDLNTYFEDGKSIVLLSMHYNNWEWSCYMQKILKHQNIIVYNPVRGNMALEKFMLGIRGKWGSKFIPVHKPGRATFSFHKGKIPAMLSLVADQSPHPSTNFWTTFLNQETGFFNGPERIAKITNQPVFILIMKKIKRGYYEVYFHKLIELPSEKKENEIMLAYSKKLEEVIKETPEYYLWSHRRWKHKRPENIPLAEGQ